MTGRRLGQSDGACSTAVGSDSAKSEEGREQSLFDRRSPAPRLAEAGRQAVDMCGEY